MATSRAPRMKEDVLLQPAAEPVDTYIRPRRYEVDETWGEVAKGLSKLAPEIDQLASQRNAEADEEDKLRGEAAAHAANGKGWVEAVKEGSVPAQASRAFMTGYKSTQGAVVGADIARKIQTEYETWGGRTSEDPNAFNTFAGERLKAHLSGIGDAGVLRGVLPAVRQSIATLQQKHISDINRNVQEGFTRAMGARASQTLDAAHADGVIAGGDPDYGKAADIIMADRNAAVASGKTEEQADKTYTDAVTTFAVMKKDLKALDAWFNRKVPGKDYTYGETEYGRSEKNKAVDQIERLKAAEATRSEKLRKEADAKALEDVNRRTIGSIVANPGADIPEDLLKEGEKLDGQFRINATRWRSTVLEGKGKADPEVSLRITADIIGGKGMQVITDGLRRGDFANPEDLRSAFNLLKQVEASGGKLDAALGYDSTKGILGAINKATQDADDLTRPFAPEGLSPLGVSVQHAFRQQILEWIAANPNASRTQTEAEISRLGVQTLKSIQREGGGTGAATVGGSREGPAITPPTGEAPRRPGAPIPGAASDSAMAAGRARAGLPPAGAPPATPTAPTAPAAPAAAPTGPPRETTAPAPGAAAPADEATVAEWYGGLPGDQKAVMEQLATKQGITARQLARRYYEAEIAAKGPRPPAAVAAPPAAPTGAPALGPTRALPSGAADSGRTAAASGNDPTAEVLETVSEDRVPSQAVLDRVTAAFEGGISRARTATSSTGGHALAVIRDNPRAAAILDFVAGPESKGNYNAYFSNADSTRDLSQMSLRDLQGWMGNRGTKSSATGRYQFMKATLFGQNGRPGLVQRLGVPMDAKFTPELQDRLAIQLLKDRGFDKWQAGQLSDREFALNLSKEWAGLPNPRTGKSFYAGDGLNKHGVSVGSVLAALDGARGQPGQLTQVASRPTASDALPAKATPFGPGDVYANIPPKDDRGEDQLAKFMRWNPDPVGNHEKELAKVDQRLASVVRKAQQDNPGIRMVLGSGKRDAALQAEAVKWGWSKTHDSNHAHGRAVDIWVLDEKGRVVFDEAAQERMAAAVKKAAKDLGVPMRWGGDFRSFKDRPHFELHYPGDGHNH